MRRALLATLLGASLLAGLPGAVLAAPEPPQPVGPAVVTGTRNGPMSLSTGQDVTVGRLDVPAGSWVSFARFETYAIQGDPALGGGWADVDCDLRSGKPGHRVTIRFIEARPDVELQQSATFGSSGGRFTLVCRGTNARIVRVRMLAIKVQKITRIQLPSGTTTTTGEGQREAIHLSHHPWVPLAPGSWTTIADLPLSAGRWWVDATLGVADLSDDPDPDPVDCILIIRDVSGRVVHDSDRIRAAGFEELWTGTLDLTHDLPAISVARVRCHTVGADVSAGRLRITAVRLDASPSSTRTGRTPAPGGRASSPTGRPGR